MKKSKTLTPGKGCTFFAPVQESAASLLQELGGAKDGANSSAKEFLVIADMILQGGGYINECVDY